MNNAELHQKIVLLLGPELAQQSKAEYQRVLAAAEKDDFLPTPGLSFASWRFIRRATALVESGEFDNQALEAIKMIGGLVALASQDKWGEKAQALEKVASELRDPDFPLWFELSNMLLFL